MNLEKLHIAGSSETTMEMKEVTVTLAFEFVDGKCVDETLQPLYDYVAPKAEVIEEPIVTDTEYELN